MLGILHDLPYIKNCGALCLWLEPNLPLPHYLPIKKDLGLPTLPFTCAYMHKHLPGLLSLLYFFT